MSHRKMLAVAGLAVVILLAIAGYAQAQTGASGCRFVPHSLIGASLDEVKKAALDFTCTKLELNGVTPQIRLARFLTPVEFVNLFHNGRNDGACREQQFALVILKGDFKEKPGAFPGYVDSTNGPHFEYFALVFDLREGDVQRFQGSGHGEAFREILNDPTIPTEVPRPTPRPNQTRFALPGLPNPTAMPSCAYGTLAPTVVPPGWVPTRKPYP